MGFKQDKSICTSDIPLFTVQALFDTWSLGSFDNGYSVYKSKRTRSQANRDDLSL